MATPIAMIIIFGAAAYFIGRMRARVEMTFVLAGFAVFLAGLYTLGGMILLLIGFTAVITCIYKFRFLHFG